jgi:hypothetical protein
MTAPVVPSGSGSPTRPKVDVGQLWAGRAATAIVAGLVALVGVLVCRWLFNVPILAPKGESVYSDAHTTDFVLAAAGAAFLATALAHLLLVSTPGPLLFFWWIVGLATMAVALYRFSPVAPLAVKAATAAADLVIGIAIGLLLSGVVDSDPPLPGLRVRAGLTPWHSAAREDRRQEACYSPLFPWLARTPWS